MTINNAYLIKGYLLDKNPPKEVTEALEAVIEELGVRLDIDDWDRKSASVLSQAKALVEKAQKARDAIAGTQQPVSVIPFITSQDAESSIVAHYQPKVNAELVVADNVEQTAKSTTVLNQLAEEPAPPKPRPKRVLSPEEHAAAVARMEKARAAKKTKQQPENAEAPEPEIAEPEPQPPLTEPDLRITIQKPERTSRLIFTDWAEIKEMLASGRSRDAIAGDYEEDREDLDNFIANCELMEAKTPGEALASQSEVASDAAKTTSLWQRLLKNAG